MEAKWPFQDTERTALQLGKQYSVGNVISVEGNAKKSFLSKYSLSLLNVPFRLGAPSRKKLASPSTHITACFFAFCLSWLSYPWRHLSCIPRPQTRAQDGSQGRTGDSCKRHLVVLSGSSSLS